ncbi:hypothetical protein GQ55_3G467600 [Panicum hallii var. hallii]|uniref:Uncharacterized protein n=1 Tax=Panicum hallii var. hallii TaxID=1504633 RepID=A0A2T7EJ42_9POAL|nr:hypothetical protein GQ55_3G467600 [Panicum hallii var. hallii]
MFVNVFDEVPTLCVLLTEVTKVPYEGVVQRKLTWDCPRKFISWCEDQCHVTRDSLTERFCAFLGESNCDVEKLRRYPHNWDDAIKGEYLMSLVASDHSNMWLLLRGSDLTWPFAENSPQRSCNLPELLQSILAWEAQRGRKYNILDFFSYIILLTNCYKHREDLPQNIKDVFIDCRALIAHIEVRTPDFWIRVYEKLGWP